MKFELLKFPFKFLMESADGGGGEEVDACCVILFLFGKIQSIFLSVELDDSYPLISFLLRSAVGAFTLDPELFAERQGLDLLGGDVEELLGSVVGLVRVLPQLGLALLRR